LIVFPHSLSFSPFSRHSGQVVGLLKVGRKSLYVFDKFGDTKHVNAPCVLDFYIHESRQRSGLGKVLFEHMLEFENLLPEQMAIDRPSEKLLSFLRKHYGKLLMRIKLFKRRDNVKSIFLPLSLSLFIFSVLIRYELKR
jgi:GNAT superfamily N-acetyltransferase